MILNCFTRGMVESIASLLCIICPLFFNHAVVKLNLQSWNGKIKTVSLNLWFTDYSVKSKQFLTKEQTEEQGEKMQSKSHWQLREKHMQKPNNNSLTKWEYSPLMA
jgi:hypothetical protein